MDWLSLKGLALSSLGITNLKPEPRLRLLGLTVGKKVTIAFTHLKIFAGDTQNMNESRINLDL